MSSQGRPPEAATRDRGAGGRSRTQLLVALGAGTLGVVGVGYALLYVVRTPMSPFATLVAASLPLTVASLLAWVAVGLYRGRFDAEYGAVARWGLAGTAVVTVFGAYFPVVGRMGTLRFELGALLTVSAGALAGIGVGLYGSQRVRIEQLRRYERTVESVRDGVFAVDDDGRIALVNEAMADLVGEDRDELVGAGVGTLAGSLDGDDRLRADGSRADLADLEGRVEVVTPPDDRGEVVCELDVRAPGAREDGGVVGVARDVTRYRRLQQQLSVTNRILRHNLRTRANVIRGRARGLEVDAADEDTADAARAVRTEAESLAALAEKAGVLAEIGQKDRGVEAVETDLAADVREVVGDVRDRFPDAEVELDAPDTLRVEVFPKLEHAVAEAVENAVVHDDGTGGDPPRVRVTLDRDGEWARIRVADEGPGIPAHERAVLERGVETDLDHGSGIGLWLMTWIVELCGGHLAFEENDPRGSVVEMRVPVEDPTPELEP